MRVLFISHLFVFVSLSHCCPYSYDEPYGYRLHKPCCVAIRKSARWFQKVQPRHIRLGCMWEH